MHSDARVGAMELVQLDSTLLNNHIGGIPNHEYYNLNDDPLWKGSES